ncbi:MAG: phospholipase D-like domain-containing protein [Burkholderiaceae bacterium]
MLFDAFWRGDRYTSPAGRNGIAALVSNHNRSCRHRIRCLYSDSIAGARKHVYLTVPYFVPDMRMQQRLMSAAQRGVDVRLLVPARTDVPITRWAAQAFYSALIGVGVRIYEYQPRMLHTKTLVIDGQWAALGTANFDYRSFYLNYELILTIREPDLCSQLEQQFLEDLSESTMISAGIWAKRRWPQRVLESIGWAIRHWL